MITLYQFQFSHFCEKARWALDYKGLSYRIENLLPGLHLRTIRDLAPLSTVPVIRDGETVVQDSTEIIDHLDRHYPQALLTPESLPQAEAARDRELDLAARIGIPLRLWLFRYLLDDRETALRIMLDEVKAKERMLFERMFPKMREHMLLTMNINETSANRAKETFSAALKELDEQVTKAPFLIADRFSRVDLTACSLLSPFCTPRLDDTQAAELLPRAVSDLRGAHRERPYFNWVLETYRKYRATPVSSREGL